MNILEDQTNSGLIIFTQLNLLNQLKLDQITLKNIDCQNCVKGLLSALFSQTEKSLPKIVFEQIKITQSQCGKSSCVIFSNGQIFNSRILKESLIYQLGYELIINHYDCINNTAVNGTCLMRKNYNLSAIIKGSNFKGNNASLSGGSIYGKGNKLFIIEESIIAENMAYQGGGYFSDQLMLNLSNFRTEVKDNNATFYGNDKVSTPSQLAISFDGQILQTLTIEKNNSLSIDQVKITEYKIVEKQIENVLYLPTGQEIHAYQYYDWKSLKYVPLDWKFRILALNSEKIIQKNLSNTECSIQSRLHHIKDNSDEPFVNNYTNLQKFKFNDTSQDYNLDNLIIYFDFQTPNDIVLQLQFSCTSIQIPVYNIKFPYNILDYHTNYYLRLNIRSFKCQLGEIKQNESCVLCDSTQGLFSIQPNSIKCSVMEDISTISVKPAQLNIKEGFWRPYLDIIKDLNLVILIQQVIAQIYGYNSCFLGHIGALCEQCDLYNIRGHGSFSLSINYSCGPCVSMVQNALLITAISIIYKINNIYIWTLITIFISVKSTLKAIQQCMRIITLTLLKIAVAQQTSQLAILIKMLTNFLQIVVTISTFQLTIPFGIYNIINAVGNPISTMAYSLDCLLNEIKLFYYNLNVQL